MTLVQDKLPCSQNFFRFQSNYEKYMDDKSKCQQDPSRTRQIASPKYLMRLSPVDNILTKSGELKKRSFNIDT